MFLSTVVATVQRVNLAAVVGCIAFGLVAGYLAIYAWRDSPGNESALSSTYRGLPSMTATLPASSGMFLSWACFGLLQYIGNPKHGSLYGGIVECLQLIFILASLLAICFIFSLAFWRRPRRLVPPSLR
jgi:hypothetical protein